MTREKAGGNFGHFQSLISNAPRRADRWIVPEEAVLILYVEARSSKRSDVCIHHSQRKHLTSPPESEISMATQAKSTTPSTRSSTCPIPIIRYTTFKPRSVAPLHGTAIRLTTCSSR